MTPSNTDTELSERDWRDDLITILASRMIANNEDRQLVAPFIERWADERAKAQLAEKREALLKAVGEDEPDDGGGGYYRGRNFIREELRQAIESIYGGEK
jgi:hypothetical protein